MGKNSLLISLFSYYYLQIKFVSFLRVWPATIPCKRKTIKWATTLDVKKKGKGKKERSSARKNKKAASLHPISRKICPCCCKTNFLSFPCWLAENQSKKEELVHNAVFSLLSGIRQRVNPFVPEWPVTTRFYPCPLYRLRRHQFSRFRTTNLKLHFVEWTLSCF